MKTIVWASLLVLGLSSCTIFVQSGSYSTKVGVEVNHEKALEFVFNIFAKDEEASNFTSIVNDK